MIELTRFNGQKFLLNEDLIKTIEALPDSTIKTVNGKTYVAAEKVDEIIVRIIAFRNACGGIHRLSPAVTQQLGAH